MTEKRFSLLSSWFHGIEAALFFSFIFAFLQMDDNLPEGPEESFWEGFRRAFDYWIDTMSIYQVLYIIGGSLVLGAFVHLIKHFWKRVFGSFKGKNHGPSEEP